MKLRKPFQVVRSNTRALTGGRKGLLAGLAKAEGNTERNKILQNALYPNRLKRVDEVEK